jgi:hypothetical protein
MLDTMLSSIPSEREFVFNVILIHKFAQTQQHDQTCLGKDSRRM